MTGISLNKALKEQGTLSSDVGEFAYSNSLGEGGNSYVFKFNKGDDDFAIKFLKHNDPSKLDRFKDEFFCAMQIPTHKNIVSSYHFDKVTVSDNDYFIIIMKHYQGTLSSEGCIKELDEKERSEKAWKLFYCLASALSHLHSNHIIHRDLKPQNIFNDAKTEEYVLGDLGIAHFSDIKFQKESKTKPSDRMANFGFSAPEQINSKNPVTAASDIYSLGQVIHWYLTEQTIRGLGSVNLSKEGSPEKLKWLDAILEKCLKNEPSARFQSIDEITDFIQSLKKPPRHDYWPSLHKFDDVIRRSFPKIKGIIETSDANKIDRFISNFKSDCSLNDFWYMSVDGGDNTCGNIEKISDNKWLFCNELELELAKLIVYQDYSYPYKDFFIFLIDSSEPFDIVDEMGNPIKRDISSDSKYDYATFWNKKYIDSNETSNGYYESNGEVIRVDNESFSDRLRYLKKYAYIIVPKGTATAVMNDRTPTERFLKSVVQSGKVEDDSLRKYLDETRNFHSSEITMWN